MKKNNSLCVIPARGGSKSILKKNIKKLNKIPLIAYSIIEALKVFKTKNVVVSTDDDDIAKISEEYGCEIFFKRPKKLSTDNALSYDVVLHCLKFMENYYGNIYENIMMLQPTSPFRKSKHIRKSLELIEKKNVDSVVSVVNVNGYHPYRMKKIKNNFLYNFIDQGFEDMRPRQSLPSIFIRNGAIYLNTRDVILKQKSLVGKRVKPLVMEAEESINIDSKIDFYVADSILKNK